MKTDFPILIKSMRLILRPEFKSIMAMPVEKVEILDQAISELEDKQNQLIVDNGYTKDEFNSLYREYFMDFSSENPDEWIIRHDPENAQIISGN
jgi:hypothetical protein